MANKCVTCSGYIKNTGLPSGDKPFGRIVGMYFVPLLADDGTPNFLDLTAPSIDAELLGKINNPDPSKRWYPMLNLNNVAPSQEDAVYETDDAGNRFKVRDGLQTMSYQFWNVSHNYFRQVASACVKFGIVLIDECGNLLGEFDDVNFHVYPRAVNENSFNGVYSHATPTETSKVSISFDYKLTTSDADQYMVGASAFTTVSPLYLNGMVDLKIWDPTPAAGSVDIKMQTPFGAVNDPIAWLGGSTANITIVNHTAGTTVAPTTVVGNGGLYTITFAPQTAGDELSISVFAAANGNNEFGYEGESETWQTP